jgi:predicted XRE-type DNA-binding protein
MKRKPFNESSGNIFLDLGFPPKEAESLLIRSELMSHLRELIRRRRLTQARAARLFGVSQPRVSDLVRGKVDLFSIDALIGMFLNAKIKVRFVLGQRAA